MRQALVKAVATVQKLENFIFAVQHASVNLDRSCRVREQAFRIAAYVSRLAMVQYLRGSRKKKVTLVTATDFAGVYI